MQKRLLSLLLAVALLLTLLCGCTQTQDDDTPTLNGVALQDYVIVYEDATVKKSADQLVEQFKLTFGVELSLIAKSAFTGADNVIFIGGFDYNSYGERRYAITAKQTDAGQEIYLYAEGFTLAAAAVQCFTDEYLQKTMRVEGLDQRYAWREKDYASQLTVKSETVTTPTEGLTYIERSYTRADGKNLNTYIAIISPALVPYIKVAAPAPGQVATVPSQAQAAGALLSVNAGFFDIHATNLPSGVCIADGTVQNPPVAGTTHGNLWFGITNDGKAVISDASDYYEKYEGALPFAVGGNTLPIKNGKLGSTADKPEPRTAVGVCADGSVVVVCVDGRTMKSAGATYADIAQIYMDLDMDIRNVLNLDGGGSTTMVLRENGVYNVKNTPSDGSLRPIQSVLLLCPPAG